MTHVTKPIVLDETAQVIVTKLQGIINAIVSGGSDHSELTNRDIADQHPIAAITGLQAALEGKQETISDLSTIRSGASAGATAVQPAALQAVTAKIPEQASTTNQLADKAFVNSSIATNTAYFRGTYDVVDDLHLTFDATEAQVAAALASIITEVTNNDYAFVVFVDTTTELPTRYDRYKYGTQDNEWQYEFTLNNSSFTANEWAAIQSGITSALVAKLGALPTAMELAASLLEKYVKPSSGIPESDLSSGVRTKLNEQEVFVATYGETTFAEIVAAYMAGKFVVGKASNGAYAVLSLINTLYQVSFSYVLDGKVYQFGIGIVGDWSERDVISLSDTISAQSTDNQFPTAKATYDAINPTKGSAIPSGGMLPNILYALGTLSGAVTTSLATPADANICNHYFFTFETGATAPTITWDMAITKWAGNCLDASTHLPVISASKHYEVSVLDGTGFIMEV